MFGGLYASCGQRSGKIPPKDTLLTQWIEALDGHFSSSLLLPLLVVYQLSSQQSKRVLKCCDLISPFSNTCLTQPERQALSARLRLSSIVFHQRQFSGNDQKHEDILKPPEKETWAPLITNHYSSDLEKG